MKFRRAFDQFYASIESTLQALPPRDRGACFRATHETSEWAFELAAHPRVLDAVESLLGPDLLIWSTQWFPKLPKDPSFISWHQDGTYWGLEPPTVCTAWIALTESTDDNGCLRVAPGTQHAGQLPHMDTDSPDNALSRGQEVAVDVADEQAVSLALAPGEMSIHHIGVVHGSRANASDHARIGLAVRFIAPNVVRAATESDQAMLVRGHDAYGHFTLVDPPSLRG